MSHTHENLKWTHLRCYSVLGLALKPRNGVKQPIPTHIPKLAKKVQEPVINDHPNSEANPPANPLAKANPGESGRSTTGNDTDTGSSVNNAEEGERNKQTKISTVRRGRSRPPTRSTPAPDEGTGRARSRAPAAAANPDTGASGRDSRTSTTTESSTGSGVDSTNEAGHALRRGRSRAPSTTSGIPVPAGRGRSRVPTSASGSDFMGSTITEPTGSEMGNNTQTGTLDVKRAFTPTEQPLRVTRSKSTAPTAVRGVPPPPISNPRVPSKNSLIEKFGATADDVFGPFEENDAAATVVPPSENAPVGQLRSATTVAAEELTGSVNANQDTDLRETSKGTTSMSMTAKNSENDNNVVPGAYIEGREGEHQGPTTSKLNTSIDPNKPIRGRRTGTQPFMSLRILMDENAEELPEDDVESFFWVFIYVCSMFTGPRTFRTDPPYYIQSWLSGLNDKSLADAKKGWLGTEPLGFEYNLRYITPYFESAKPLIRKLADAVRFPSAGNLNHAFFIKTFKEEKRNLPAENPVLSDDLYIYPKRDEGVLPMKDLVDIASIEQRRKLRTLGPINAENGETIEGIVSADPDVADGGDDTDTDTITGTTVERQAFSAEQCETW